MALGQYSNTMFLMSIFLISVNLYLIDNSSINYIETNLTGVEVSVTELVEIKREIPIFIYILVAIIALFLFFTMTFLVTFITIAIAIRKCVLYYFMT